MYFRLCFSFSWYDLTLIKKSHLLSFYSVFLLLVTVVAQFTAPFTSEKAMYFLSLISCSINKLKSHIFTCKSWKWWVGGGGGGGGGRPPPPPPPPPTHHFQLLHVNMWDFNLFIEQDISDKKYIAFSEVNGAVNWATTVTNNKKTE